MHSQNIWGCLTLPALILIFIFLIALWYRWLRPDPEFLSFTANIATLIAIASLLGLQTDWGERVARQMVQALGLLRLRNHPKSIFLITGILSVILGLLLFIGSPLISNYYNRWGAEAVEKGQYSQAVRLFRQAINHSNKNKQAHFNLGNTHEVLRNYQEAIVEYQMTLELDDSFWPAYNNLGRLYLVSSNDAESALAVLLTGQGYVTNPLGQAVMHKNIGWALLEKGLLLSAVDQLNEAATRLDQLANQGNNVSTYQVETYRLTAVAFEKMGKSDKAQRAWFDALGYALAVSESPPCVAIEKSRSEFDCANARIWTDEANERLNNFEEENP